MSEQIRARTLLYYALPALPAALLGLPLYIYLPTYYAQDLSLGVFTVGAVLLAARLLDMLSDPLLGILSDRLKARKPLMLLGSIIMTGAFYALAHPDKSHGTLWLLGFSLLIYTGWSLFSIPYLSLNAELSARYHDKTRLASARESAAIVGVVSALALPYAYAIAEDAGATLGLLASVLLLLTPVLMLLFWQGVREPVAARKQQPLPLASHMTLWRQIDGLPRLMGAYLVNNLANALPATLFLFYVSLVIGRADKTGLLLLLYFASGLAALPLWVLLARRIGKRRSWMASMALAAAAFAFVPTLSSGDLGWFTLISVVSGLSLGADMALPAAIQADTAHAAEDSGKRIAGVLFGLWSMLTKLALALSVGIAFGILALAGFDAQAPTSFSVSVLGLLYGPLPVVLKLFALWLMTRYHEVR